MQNQQQWLKKLLFFIALLLLCLLSIISWLTSASWLWLFTIWSITIPVLFFCSEIITTKLEKPYYNLLNQLDALLVDDYSVQAKIRNTDKGIDNQVFSSISKLSLQLNKNKKNYNENNLLFYSLIQALNSPVLLLNADKQLIQGNQALSHWLKKDWRLQRLTKVEQLGLVLADNIWQVKDLHLQSKYKIRSSNFTLENNQHHLLILTDISHELRKMQQQAWQQLIRVLSHEIKNSLTPIKSMAQTLADFSSQKEQKDALNVIVQRSQSLNDFVTKYGQISRVYQVNKEAISLNELFTQLIPLYPNSLFHLSFDHESIFADKILLQQVVINLIENAQQAFLASNYKHDEQCQINISCRVDTTQCLLTIKDNGIGVQNLDNLFVPFYTTKPTGSGIGLTLSRNIIEQHGGHLTLSNNLNNTGACAFISLPL